MSTTSACAWTASSNASWITITSGASGTGNGRVGYLVLPNVGGSRTGTLTVAGETFTVSQAALVVLVLDLARQSEGGSAGRYRNGQCVHQQRVHVDGVEQRVVDHGDVWRERYRQRHRDVQLRREHRRSDRKGTLTVAGRTFTVEQDENKEVVDREDTPAHRGYDGDRVVRAACGARGGRAAVDLATCCRSSSRTAASRPTTSCAMSRPPSPRATRSRSCSCSSSRHCPRRPAADSPIVSTRRSARSSARATVSARCSLNARCSRGKDAPRSG